LNETEDRKGSRRPLLGDVGNVTPPFHSVWKQVTSVT